MSNILYLVHRIPYPPNKGDKVRSFNLLKHLALDHRIFLGSFIDDRADERFIPQCSTFCASAKFVFINRSLSKLKSALSVVTTGSLSVAFYRSRVLQAWVDQVVRDEKIDTIIVFSGVMAQFVPWQSISGSTHVLIDFVDVDSMKWAEFAAKRKSVSAWFFGQESRKLLTFEKSMAEKASYSFFVTEREADKFRALAPKLSDRIFAVENGVDVEYFRPSWARTPVFSVWSDKVVVFTGAMDYWPNVDAVEWFASCVFPRLAQSFVGLRFFIVGRNPTRAVSLLARESIVVTGQVADVRPYLQFADLIVAPLRVARGVQNKVLEALAMEKPVVASAACADALHPAARAAISVAHDADEFVSKAICLLNDPAAARVLGERARKAVVEHYSWPVNLSRFNHFLPARSEVLDEALS